MRKEILLARPSVFIVNNMKALIEGIECDAVPLGSMKELNDHKTKPLCGIVISTGVTSILPVSFDEVLESVIKEFPGTPLFLASMSSSPGVRKSISNQIKLLGCTKTLATVDELPGGKRLGNDFVLLLTKSDLTDKNRYHKTLQSFKNMFTD